MVDILDRADCRQSVSWFGRKRPFLRPGHVTLELAVVVMLRRYAGELGVATTLFDEPARETHHA